MNHSSGSGPNAMPRLDAIGRADHRPHDRQRKILADQHSVEWHYARIGQAKDDATE